ncbi:MAG: oligosaccharide flippase family protein [Lewinellaceae bacterium]|nr:oligosaccharide flippase family protein [Lewinellaceae bacterium]
MNIIVKPLYLFGIDVHVQNLLGIHTYGLYFDYFNFVFIFQFIADPGLQNWNSQWLSKNRSKAPNHIIPLLVTKILLSIAFFIAIFLVSFFLGYDDKKLLFFLGLNIVLITFFSLGRTVLSGIGHYRFDSFFSALDKTLLLIIVGGLLMVNTDFSLYTFVLGQTAAFFLSNCILWYVILKNKVAWEFSVNFSQIQFILKKSLPFLYILLFMTAYNRLDGVMLGRMLDDQNFSAGIYATAFRFYDAANMVAYLFAVILLPLFSAHIYQTSQLKDIFQMGLKLMLLFSTVTASLLIFYGYPILSMQFTDYISEYYRVLILLSISFFMVSFTYVYGTFLLAADRVKQLNIVYGITLGVNFLTNLLMIPQFQAIGAAWTTVITQTFVLAAEIFLTSKVIGSLFSGKEWFKFALFILLSALTFFSISHFMSSWNWLGMISSMIICLLLFFILKIIPLGEVKSLFTKQILASK